MATALQRNARQRGLGAGSFAGEVARAMARTQRLLNDVGGATSDEMRAAGRVLVRAIRKTIGVKGAVLPGGATWLYRQRKRREFAPEARNAPRRAPSAPGAAPHVQTARLRRSVTMTPVDGALRVGTNRFTGRLLEDGVRFAGAAAVARGTRYTTASGKRRTSRGRQARRAVTIAPRPFMERALRAAEAEMTDALVSGLQRRLPR